MAIKIFRRQALEELGITDKETIDKIMNLHLDVVNPLKDERDEWKAKAESISTLEKEKADLEKQVNSLSEQVKSVSAERDDFKTKHETEKAEHDKLKADVSGRELHAKKESVLRNELKSKKYSDEAAHLILSKGGYTDKIELDKDGKATNIDSIFNDIHSDFAMFTPKENVKISVPENPPINAGGKTAKTKSDIMGIKNNSERQKEILANRELFDF